MLPSAQQSRIAFTQLRIHTFPTDNKGIAAQSTPSDHWEVYGGIVCRKRTSQNDGHDSLRPYVPESLRLKVLNNYHTSVWGVHRSEKATFREVASRYFWPQLGAPVLIVVGPP